MLKISRGRDTMRFADGNDAVAGASHLASHSHGGRTMKKLFTIAVAVLLSLGVASLGYAQAPTTTEKKTEEKKTEEKKAEKKTDGKMDTKTETKTEKKVEKKANGKTVEKKTEKMKTEKKDAANPCAAKAAEKK